jgi:hypothetical protein
VASVVMNALCAREKITHPFARYMLSGERSGVWTKGAIGHGYSLSSRAAFAAILALDWWIRMALLRCFPAPCQSVLHR